MEVRVCHPSELDDGEVAVWRSFQATDQSFDNAFLSPEFAILIGHQKQTARVAVIEDGGMPVGFLPYEHLHYRVGQALATGISDAQAVVHEPGFDWNFECVLHKAKLDVFEFDHFLAGQAADKTSHFVSVPTSIMDVSNGYDTYFAERSCQSKRLIKSVMQKRRKLEREHGLLEFEFKSADLQLLHQLMVWKSAQYRRTGRSDRFSRQWIAGFVEDALTHDSQTCSGVLSVIRVQGKPIAIHFGLRSHTRLSLWFPSYDQEFAKYSPGLILFLEMAKAAADHGITLLDLGKGDEPYKHSLRSSTLPVAEGWVGRLSPVSVARAAHRVPVREVERFVLRHDRLRVGARNVLKGLGSLRESVKFQQAGLQGREAV